MAPKKKKPRAPSGSRSGFSFQVRPPGQPERVPPEDQREGFGPSDDEEYLRGGQSDSEKMMKLLKGTSFVPSAGSRILDFGCASGRMIRWMREITPQSELWGVDVDERHIQWCNRNLPESLKFVHIPLVPHLPFKEGFFDLIYAGSVFSHLHPHTDAWLLELLRILGKNGRLYLTINDRSTLDGVLADERNRKRFVPKLVSGLLSSKDLLKMKFESFVFEGDYKNQMIFYDVEYLKAHWQRFANILAMVPKAFGGQTAVILSHR